MPLVTYSGIEFNHLAPTKEMINIDDIVTALHRLNRFVGHSSRAYNVAEHSFNCFKMAELLGYSDREKFLTLIHDFTEAYVGDCPTPLKMLLPDFSVIEKKVELAIYDYIDISPPTEEEEAKIKVVDLTMLAIEMRDLTHHDWLEFTKDDRVNCDVIASFSLNPEQNYSDSRTSIMLFKKLFEVTLQNVKREQGE
ncbi:YfbR-like 5'-deoxynucleotidase [Bacillus mojavensis]